MTDFENQQSIARLFGPSDLVTLVLGASDYGDLLVIQNQDGDNVAALSKDGDLKTVKGVFTADTDSIGQE